MGGHPHLGKGTGSDGDGMKKDCVYEIRVEGHIPADWSDWYEGLTIRNEANGEAVISGPITDQAALMGILNRATAMNITLIWVRMVEGLDL